MTALRLVSLPTHAGFEMLIGLALMVLPFALGLSSAAMVAGVVAGAVVFGLALQAAELGTRSSLSAHHAADHGVAIGLAGAALVLSAADGGATVLFGVAAVAQAALTLTTRYSAR